ncbi:hypothetical protein B0H19DRAFT_690237 [Mycena capillaripes]|nr:hypothetical protein B0H19DRAFT_690237 [Mycena capillaripes]
MASLHSDESQEQSAAIYKQIYEILDDIGEVEDAEVRLRVMTGQDHCKYNLPAAEEVAVILPSNGSEGDGRDIILRNPTLLMHHYSVSPIAIPHTLHSTLLCSFFPILLWTLRRLYFMAMSQRLPHPRLRKFPLN